MFEKSKEINWEIVRKRDHAPTASCFVTTECGSSCVCSWGWPLRRKRFLPSALVGLELALGSDSKKTCQCWETVGSNKEEGCSKVLTPLFLYKHLQGVVVLCTCLAPEVLCPAVRADLLSPTAPPPAAAALWASVAVNYGSVCLTGNSYGSQSSCCKTMICSNAKNDEKGWGRYKGCVIFMA